jgi:hypothetical protein
MRNNYFIITPAHKHTDQDKTAILPLVFTDMKPDILYQGRDMYSVFRKKCAEGTVAHERRESAGIWAKFHNFSLFTDL